ncbi:cytochrome P450 [Pseudonocardia ailaonensis]|uniref:Cytochrome P450 n=1 Tax=Pseudonocardia ailaonensis TaxID=367279 RepID=A0ABN2NBI9_9PSEU
MVASLRERYSSALTLPLPGRLDAALLDRSSGGDGTPLGPVPEGLLPIPGDDGLPLLGHALGYVRFGHELTRRRTAHYGPVWWMRSPTGRAVVVGGVAATREVLTNRDKAFSQEGWRVLVDRFFHRGLMLLDFDEHRAHRRIMQEAFTADRIATYVDETVPVVRGTVPTWSGSMRLYPALKAMTLDVATRVFMDGGGRADHRDGGGADHRLSGAAEINRAFVDCVRAANAFVRYPIPGTRWSKGLRGRAVLERWFREALPTKRSGTGDDLFSALCHAVTPEGERFSDDDVVNHMIFLMMAAHDTSTVATASAAYHLGRHPEWQERARAESLALGDAPPGVAELRSLTTLDRVVREALRMDAPVPVVMRTAVKDTQVAGRFVPAGTRVVVAQAVNHYDPECWTDPEAFDPGRFDGPVERDAWVPFGGGVHKCIGLHFGTLEVTAILHEMLRTFRWTVEPGRQRWDNTSLPVPVGGIPVQLSPL